jgi:glyoxylase-like metal-dependent hydrolase (beta-lactamase superfamily II)
MLRSDAAHLADAIAKSGKTLKTVVVSHEHPDHYMGLDVIRSVSSGADRQHGQRRRGQADGPWMVSMLPSNLGPDGPTRLVVPDVLVGEPVLRVGGHTLNVVEFGEGESDAVYGNFTGIVFC